MRGRGDPTEPSLLTSPHSTPPPLQECFLKLEAPIARVCGVDTPFPLAFEKLYLPDELKVYDAIKRTVHF